MPATKSCLICNEHKPRTLFTTCLDCEQAWCLDCESRLTQQPCPFCRTLPPTLPPNSAIPVYHPAAFNALPASTVVPPGMFVIVAADPVDDV